MFVQRKIGLKSLIQESWVVLVASTAWSSLIYYLNVFTGIELLAIPMAPVTIIGVAVSLYLGFKSTSAYNRWWEARKIWGEIVNLSRSWGASAFNLISAPDGTTDDAHRLIRRHLAWVNALAYQLRKDSRLKATDTHRIFGHRRSLHGIDHQQSKESYERFLTPEEAETFDAYTNPATQIMRRQADELRTLTEDGALDSYRQVALMELIWGFYDTQGKCERIKKTPFPRQVANFGEVFTWVFIVLLPLALTEVFLEETFKHHVSEEASHAFLLVMVPFTVLISWVFYIMERVSDSTEDPFEGGVTDVPISAITRTIEIDLEQMIDAETKKQPLQPIDGVLY